MGRKVNRNYQDHDDISSGRPKKIVRKVIFSNGSDRVSKNKRLDNFALHYMNDNDVDMGGTQSHAKSWKGSNRRQRNTFKGRPGSPGVRGGSQMKPLVPSDWYQVKIPYGAKYNKTTVLQLILNHIQPNIFIPNSYITVGRDVFFYVDDIEIAKILRSVNRKISFEDGFLLETRVREGLPPSVPVDDNVKEKIKLVMAKRYIAENKALDLSNFSSDPDLKGEFYCPLSRPAIMKVVWQIISENISDLVAINLSKNKISTFDDILSVEIKKLKNLKILHLEENKIKTIHVLHCFKGAELTELVLKKNPLVNSFKDNTHYVSVIRKKFPKLIKLDDIELPALISFDVTDESKLPPPQAAYMCNPEGRGIVQAFLSQYFAIYDSDNRLDLAQAYHENSTFSICSFYPPNQKSGGHKLNSYIQESRNLFRVTDYPRRKSRLHLGTQNIVHFLSKLPKSQHDLSSFVVDLTLFTPALLNLCVNGVFREPNFSSLAVTWPVRHFSRTFLIVPVGQGFCIINDMLLVTNATDSEIQCAFTEEVANPDTVQPQTPVQPGTSTTAGSPLQPPPLDEAVRLQMVQTLATRTGMNLEWSKKCLDETQWNFDRAIWTFTELQSKGSIPPEAFVK